MRYVEKILEFAVVIVCLVILGRFIYSYNETDTLDIRNAAHTKSGKTIDITVDGEINKPGVYSVSTGSTLYDVIALAGGVTDDADLGAYDMTEPLTASGKVYIKPVSGGIPVNSSQSDEKNSSLSETVDASVPSGEVYSPQNKCNINTADVHQLVLLPSIGEKIAGKIIEYRTDYGLFSDISEIREVDGIGDKTYEKLKELIKVSD